MSLQDSASRLKKKAKALLSHGKPEAERSEVGDDGKEDWKSTVSDTAKLLLRAVSDSADAFPPLKSVAGGLCFILENYEVWLTSHALLEPRAYTRSSDHRAIGRQ